MTWTRKRRICWPNPDAVCLAGGCAYCVEGSPRWYGDITTYVENTGDDALRAAWREWRLTNYVFRRELRE